MDTEISGCISTQKKAKTKKKNTNKKTSKPFFGAFGKQSVEVFGLTVRTHSKQSVQKKL